MAKNKDNDMDREVEMELEGGAAEVRVYELAFHLDPELPQEEAKNAYQSIRDNIAAHGTVVAEGEITKIPLAYTISRMETTGRRDFNSAYFGWIAYETDGATHQDVISSAQGNTRIIRFLDIRTTKEAAQHGAEMHEFYRKAPVQMDESIEEEVAPEAEIDPVLKEVGV